MKLAPSLLSADFSCLKEQIEIVEKSGAKLLHLDIMDGRFVPNITFGPLVIEAIRKSSNLVFDAHLMIDEPERYIDNFIKAGSDIISFHVEATNHIDRCVQMIKKGGKKAAVALNPATPLTAIEYILGDVDMILLMSVNPGFGGQKYIESVTQKIKRLRDMVGDSVDIEVDGGIGLGNLTTVLEAGANVIVAGSAVFGTSDIEFATKEFMRVANEYESSNYSKR